MRLINLLQACVVTASLACASPSGGEEESTSGATASGSSGDEDQSSSEASATSDAGDGSSEATSDSGDGDGGSPNCGDATCDATELCNWEMNGCGDRKWEEGACEPRPEGCDDFYDPKCGCDGEVYSNECEAHAAGVDIDENGTCDAPDGYFACGPGFCPTDSTYCLLQVSDVGGLPNIWTCEALPTGCNASPSCACLTQVVCGEMCEDTLDGGAVVTCPGG